MADAPTYSEFLSRLTQADDTLTMCLTSPYLTAEAQDLAAQLRNDFGRLLALAHRGRP